VITRVLVVDQLGETALRLDPVFRRDFTVVHSRAQAAESLELIKTHDPELVIIDVQGPDPETRRLVERVMSDRPRPIVLIANTPFARQAAFSLLEAGALEVMSSEKLEPTEARKRLKLLASVPVVRHPRGKKRRSGSLITAVPAFPLVAIACSLGGPKALAVVLAALPKQLRAPIVICQHITPGFSDDLAIWLQAETGHRVREAEHGQRMVRGEFFIAPAGKHMQVRGDGTVRLDDSAAVGGFKPSCDVLLKSVAVEFADRAIGVVLTGMGRDGAKGLKDIRNAGGHTIAQDAATSVVFGMPGEAVELGAAEVVLPLDAVAPQLVRWLS
jgi:two-component system chemotaxis response regulator CheB